MRVILSGGGTGGHLYPALAIAEKIKSEEPDSEILFVGSEKGLEAEIVPKMGYDFKAIPTQGIQESDSVKKRALINANVGIFNALGVMRARTVIRKFKPDCVVGTGGYVCFPTLMAAEISGIRTYLHEQNAVPGRANKALAKGATKLFVGFKGAEDAFGFPEKTVFTGNPVRASFSNLDKQASRKRLGIDSGDFTVLAFGGSLGSETINNIARSYLAEMKNKQGRTLLWGTGSRFYEECLDRCRSEGLPTSVNVHIEGYIDNIKDYIAASDIVICRAGALSLAEMMIAGKPAVIVPIPVSVGNHQYYNGKAISDAGGAFLVEEKDLDLKDICDKIEYLATNRVAVEEMGEICKSLATIDAADIIYREIKDA